MAIRPVKSEKEEVNFQNLSVNAGTAQTIAVITALDSPTTAGGVEIGDTVGTIFCEINFSPETVTSTKIVHWWISKRPFGTVSGNPSSYDQSDKRFIFKRGMEMLPKDVGTTIKRIFTIRLPPRFRRFGDGDKLEFKYIASSTETINVCGIFIFKHFG